MTSHVIPPPPFPIDPYEASRWRESGRRRRMMDGVWASDLKARLKLHLSPVREESWGPASLSINIFRNISRELSVLYDAPPNLFQAHLASEDALVLDQALAARSLLTPAPLDPTTRRIWQRQRADVRLNLEARRLLRLPDFARTLCLSGVWSLMQRVQAWTIGLREYGVRVDVDTRGRPRFRSVPPDRLTATPDPGRPDQAIMLRELRLRSHPETGEAIWTVDTLSVEDPDNPTYTIFAVGDGQRPTGVELTSAYLGRSVSGDAYPYRVGKANRPVIPYVIYHASKTGDRLWDTYEGIELVESSLDLAVMYCMLIHVFRDASWPQRYGIGVEVDGGEMTGGGGDRHEVDTDPASFLHFRRSEGFDGQPVVGQFAPGGDVAQMEATLSAMVARASQDAGVSPSDVQRLSGSARSGVAISLTNAGKRAAQRRFAESFRSGDERLVALAAAFMNRSASPPARPLPEGGYTVAHARIPLSPDELKSRRDHVRELVADGLMTRLQAILEINPGMSPAEARQELAAIDAERAAGQR